MRKREIILKGSEGMRLNRLILLCAMLLTPLCSASAQSDEALGFGRISQDVVIQGLAGAGFVNASTASSAAVSNPTLSLDAPYKFNSSLSYNKWAASETSYYTAGLAYRFSQKVAVSAGVVYGAGKSYDIYNSDGSRSGVFTPSQLSLSAGAAYKVLPVLSLGVNVHYLSETLAAEHSYSAVSADAVASLNFSGLKAAVGVMSLGGKVKSASGSEFSLPGSVKLAAGYEDFFLGILSYGVYFDSDYYLANSALGASVGAEAGYKGLFCLRAGYHYGSEKCLIPSYGSVGLGVGLKGCRLDLAYLFSGQLSGTLTIGVGYSF